ncbi:MAG TPA: 16S rRNA (guanine(527)-N(7))-methyltransferase RsmG [Candidatus Acidoferrales bacterium]|nr:16S rRNA (guanine(527)-N(7))-methyltransferase RsmG [Candidatus Acidoferrales bacterium]
MPTDVDALPTLSPAYDRALDAGLAATGLTLPPDARSAIERHVRLLLAWNAAINLTGIVAPEAIATGHVLDSLTALPFLPLGPLDVLDLGSGGGFPGVPLAAVRPDVQLTLVDSVAKKARFLEAAVGAAGLADRASVRAVRAEALAGTATWDVVVARAVGSLADLVELSMPLLRPGGRLIAWKGAAIADELPAARRAAVALGALPPTVHRAAPDGPPDLTGHVLAVVVKRRPTPASYPRDPARRLRHPW